MVFSSVNKNRPSSEWIESLRCSYPVEPEVDKVLALKLNKRASPAYSPQSLNTLVTGVNSLIRSEYDGDIDIGNSRWLTGGASKLQMAFDLHWKPEGETTITPLVLRMEPAASVCETSRLREHQLLQVFERILPVPAPYWVDVEAQHFLYPALIYGFVTGVTKPSRSTSNVSGLGTNFGTDLREKLAPQFIDQLALIHCHDIHDPLLANFAVPVGTHTAALWALNWWQRVWVEDAGQEVPLMRLATAWMRDNLPVTDSLSIIHADYRAGNFLFDEEQAQITGWLDWELGHIGDRHEDLAWSLSRAFGHYSEDGGEFLSCGLLPEADFIARYEEASGLQINQGTLHFYRVLSAYKAIVIVLAAGYRNATNGKSHQDVLLVWLMGLASPLIDELGALLDEVI